MRRCARPSVRMFGVLYYTNQCGTISLQLVRAARRASHVWCFIMHKSMWDDFATSFSCVARLVAAVWKTTRSKIKMPRATKPQNASNSQDARPFVGDGGW